ncbi:MAG: hypothetical protein IJ115_01010, partial [Erysipelotrichaceae bacterium]|nr:hypothetical protein [Erysipelotrichaceae bacterium]
MCNDKASKLFNGKNLSELTASWGEPIRTSANEVAYMGCFCDDEIVIKTENNKVTGVDYVNICKGRIVSVNKNEITVSIEMPEKNGYIHSYEIIYSMYNRNISNQEKEKFKEGKTVIVKYRGMAYEASPSEIEISVVE